MTSIIYDYPAIAAQLKGDGWYTPARSKRKDLSPNKSNIAAMKIMYDLEQQVIYDLEQETARRNGHPR